jgi:ribosome biogenesis protein MAK21
MMDLDESEAESSVGGFDTGSDDEGAPDSGGLKDGSLFDEADSGSHIEQLFEDELETVQIEGPEMGGETREQRRKKMKSLPTFASIEDYAEMLDNDEDEDM